MFRKLLVVCGAVALAILPVAAEAARVSPMIVEVKPLGRGSVARVELSNPGQAEFPVEVQMFRGVITEAGELELTPADELFLLFPAQRVVPARSQQVFRVQYVGDPELAASEVYYMQIRQIPVDIAPGQSQVQLIVNFNVLVNVIPDGTSPEPFVESIRPAVRAEVPGIEVRLSNRGTRYFTAGTRPWQVSGTAEDGTALDLRLPPEDMSKLIGVGVVAPGRARIFFIPTEKPLVEGTIQANLVP
ncbi:MAG: fimbria/pilus periplasmic chaperone [Alphaproteobacteria bacterium]|nr:fimbria/pilus periplasmic chaperone [Alphaproteobacteria bacterium]MBU0863722.1 fimbria/pilus periplasmic chaperone [Alphaproteobacteria bacterium]MBU1825516.1 fimbria/pilus periplasmic chaperone [Alphaproteobacteria bacterium]